MLWRKRNIEVQRIYVPVPGGKPFSELWDDRDFLARLSAMRGNELFDVLMTRLVGMIRDGADIAPTPDRLAGYNAALSAVKSVWMLPREAAERLKELAAYDNEPVGYDNGGMR